MGKITDKGYQSEYSGDTIDALLGQIGLNMQKIQEMIGSNTDVDVPSTDGKIDTLSEITYFLKDMPTNKTLSSEISYMNEKINNSLDSSLKFDEIGIIDDIPNITGLF